MAIALTHEQKTAVENRGGALLVSAAAGSGKTRVLVERLMDYVTRDKVDIDRFLIITFTNASAAELRGRVARALAQRLAERPHDGHLRRQTTLVYQAKICTIDAFCRDFIRECGHLADVDPDFSICDEAEGKDLLSAALEEVLEQHYSNIAQEPGFALLADSLSGDRDDGTLANVILDIHHRIGSYPDPVRWLRSRKDDFALPADRSPEDTLWGSFLLSDTAAQADHWAQALESLAEEAADDPVVFANYGPGLETTIDDLTNFSLACREGWVAASRCTVRFPRPGGKRGSDAAVLERIKTVRSRCKAGVEKMAQRLSLSPSDAMDDLRAIAPAMSALLTIVEETDAAFRARKARRKLLDFSDLEHLTVSLLVDGNGNPTELAREWQSRFTEIMVDEYQDTNTVQNVLFSALSRNGENLFMVGDVKQSIYRFRLAEPGIFLDKYASFRSCEEAAAGEPRKTVLSGNFRSRPEVLEGVNFLFRALMSKELGELDYTDAEALRPGRPDIPYDPRYNVELDVVDLTGLTDSEEEGKTPKALVQARAVASRISDLLKEGFPIPDGDGTRPARPEDMVILLRSPGPVLRYYAQALDEAGVPWNADGGDDFFDTTEISTALSFLQIIDNPRQDIPLLAVMRSPLFSFTPDRLALLRAQSRGGDFYTALAAGAARGEEGCSSFLSLLEELRSLSGEMSSHQLIWTLYGRVNLPAVFGAMEGGKRRRANLMALYDAALRFESGGHKGLYGFLTHIARIIEGGKPLPVSKEETGGVRIMSIHRSKGLEFPVVFLCGLDRQFNDSDLQSSILFHPTLGLGPKRTDRSRMLRYSTIARDAVSLALKKESRAEEMRLLYVALTRAEQKLILFTSTNSTQDKFIPLASQAAWPIHPQVLLGCRSPSGWLLLAAMCRGEAAQLRALAENDLPIAPPDGYRWDVHVLTADRFEKPLHHRAAAGHDTEGDISVDPELLQKLLWAYPHAASTRMPSKLTATQLKGREKDNEAAENTDSAVRTRSRATLSRPRFAQDELGLTPTQRGTAIHQAMQFMDFSANVDTPEGVAAELKRLEELRFLSPQQVQAIDPTLILAFFQSELGKELLSAPRLEREFKFSLLVPAREYYPDGEEGEELLLQGVVDCWFENEAGITVLDFKSDQVTDRTLEERARDYTPQLAAYSDALSKVLGKPVNRRVLWFFRVSRSVEI